MITPAHFKQLNWEQIFGRFIAKNNLAAEVIFQLKITSKNFSEKLKSLSATQISSIMSNLYNYDKVRFIFNLILMKFIVFIHRKPIFRRMKFGIH